MAATTTVVAALAAVLAFVALGASVAEHDRLFSIPTPSYGPPARTLQQSRPCPCLRRQILGNCGPICSCLEAQRLPTLPTGACLAVCQSCDRKLRASGCPAGGAPPAECKQPMRFAPQVQRCKAALRNRKC